VSYQETFLADSTRPIQVDFAISAPGAFCYYIEHDGADGERVTGRKGYFNVDPVMTVPRRTPFNLCEGTDVLHDTTSAIVTDKSQVLPLDSLIILSIIAKWQGAVTEWDKHLAEASRRGYNMIHYTPLHPRGSSGSPYSIKDQLAFDPTLVADPKAKDGGLDEITKVMLKAKNQYGLGAITDVVLNHTAFDSPWLDVHPEAGE
jgi:glycogen debranching enzyme